MATTFSYAHPSFLRPSISHVSFKALSSLNSTQSPSTLYSKYNHQIQTLCNQGNVSRALELLPHEPKPTVQTFESLILACRHLNNPCYGSVIHGRMIENGLDTDPFLSTRLIKMYAQFNSLSDARNVFDNSPVRTIFVWNALLQALLNEDKAEETISLFQEMNFTGGEVKPDSFSYSYALKSCISYSSDPSLALDRVKQIHCQIIRKGTDARVYVATTLIDCYAKLGLLSYAEQLFDEMPVRNVVTWTAMIGCYVRNELPYEALKLFGEMKLSGDPNLVPNPVTLNAVLQACAGLASLNQGKIIHAYILRRALHSNLSLNNALITMYMKSGSLNLGLRVFNSMHKKDVISFNSLISGYGLHGFAKDALEVFDQMLHSDISPTALSFLSVLGAYSHCGLVEEGKQIFNLMQKYKISPRAEHYSCMVDLLGRAGQLDEAVKLIQEMQVGPTTSVWGALLGACRKYCHVAYAELACSHLFKLEPKNAGNYILLMNIYTEANLPKEVDRVKKLLEERELSNLSGCSCIEIREKVYSFNSTDKINPQIEELHEFILKHVTNMKQNGYVPNTKLVLHDLGQEEKEKILLYHSEKLALAFGIINGRKGEIVRITKNLRLCEDCHNVTKYVSKVEDREILVRDVNRFHRFKDGVCSCMDYW